MPDHEHEVGMDLLLSQAELLESCQQGSSASSHNTVPIVDDQEYLQLTLIVLINSYSLPLQVKDPDLEKKTVENKCN